MLFWEYDQPIDFERSVREHLIRQILPMIPAPKKTGLSKTKGTLTVTRRVRVFLAYSHEDRQKVMMLYENLRLAGFDPWLDSANLLPGQMWHSVIENAIKSSDAIVLCLSSNSVSKSGFFQKELKTALEQVQERPPGQPFLIPVRLDKVSMPLEVGMLQYLDYFQQDGPERLVEALKLLKAERKIAEL